MTTVMISMDISVTILVNDVSQIFPQARGLRQTKQMLPMEISVTEENNVEMERLLLILLLFIVINSAGPVLLVFAIRSMVATKRSLLMVNRAISQAGNVR
jgi:hypothetical protein